MADGRPHDVFARHGDALAEAGVWVPDRRLPAPPRRPRPEPETLLLAEQVAFRYPGSVLSALARTDLQVRAAEAVAITGPERQRQVHAGAAAGRPAAADLRDRGGRRGAGAGPRPRADLALAGPGPGPLRRHRLPGPRAPVPDRQRARRADARAAADRPGSSRRPRRRADELLDAPAPGASWRRPIPSPCPAARSGGCRWPPRSATAPSVVILDEPTFGQDRRTAGELLDLLAALRDSGRAIAFVTARPRLRHRPGGSHPAPDAGDDDQRGAVMRLFTPLRPNPQAPAGARQPGGQAGGRAAADDGPLPVGRPDHAGRDPGRPGRLRLAVRARLAGPAGPHLADPARRAGGGRRERPVRTAQLAGELFRIGPVRPEQPRACNPASRSGCACWPSPTPACWRW